MGELSDTVWQLYLLECRDGSFYTGITNRLQERIEAHNDGKGAKYTRGRGPVKLLYSVECENQSEALKKEFLVKKLSKKKKIHFFIHHSTSTIHD